MDAPMNKHGLYDIYDVWHVPFWQTTTFLYSMIFLSIVLLSLIIWFIVKKLKKQKKKTPWDSALQQLNALQQSDISVEHGKEFYFTLTLIVKKYLQDRFGYPLTHRTDAESIAYLERNELLPEHIETIRTIFSGVQVIKFANAQAAQEQMLNDLQSSIQLVQHTIEKKK